MQNTYVTRGICTLAGALALALASGAHADQREYTGFYAGAAYGAVSVDGSAFDDDDTAPQIYAGVQFTPYLGVEAGYMDFGKARGDILQMEADGYSLALTGRLPVSERVALYAKVGQFWWDSDVRIRNTGLGESFSGRELTYGAGVSFALTPVLDLRISYDRLDVDLDRDEIGPLAHGNFKSDVDVLAAGLTFKF